MKREENFSPNEYRTGGHLPLQRPGGLFAVGILIFFAFSAMFLAASSLALHTDPLGEGKELAALQAPEDPIFPGGDIHMEGEVTTCTAVGIICQSISEFCEKYYELPAGIYILQVEKDSPADRQGVLPGDVLVRVNGEALRLPATLQWFLDHPQEGSPIELEFSRKGKIYSIYVASGV